ncbi:MAG TPA: PorV/PorQ family protein [candidate division Zixibacteria bacterium]|nr:PorV/PorQ family protein [candidate division Zixibacteria bacterium]
MRKIFTLAICLLLVPGISAVLAADGDGGYAASFLQIPIGARPAAMGGSYISISDDGAAPFYNPAGLSGLRKTLFASSYRAMGLDRTLGYVEGIFPAKGEAAIGVNWLYAGSGSVEARNSDGDKLGFDLSQHNHDFSVFFAKRFENVLSAGFKASYLHTKFSEMTAYSVAIDIGAMFHLSQLFDRERRDLMPIQDIQAGLVVRNLGAKYHWSNEKYYLAHSTDILGSTQDDRVPVEVGVGASARFLNRKLTLSTDLVKTEHLPIRFHGGGEYIVASNFAIRSGLSGKQFTAGTGYLFKFPSTVLAIDYAFSTDRVGEGSEHIFSFDLLF